MGQPSYDLTGLTEDQKKAVEFFAEKQKGRYFISSTPRMIIKDFLAANEQMRDSDTATRERGQVYEAKLREMCLAPPSHKPPEH